MNRNFLQAYGDSLTAGYPYSSLYSWPTFLSNQLGTAIISSGQNGRLLLEMVGEKEKNLIGFSPKYVTVLGGTNDFYMGMDAESVFLNLKELVEWIEQNRMIPIVCLPPPSTDREIEAELEVYREKIRRWALKTERLLLDFDFLFRDEKGEIKETLLADSCHPNEVGYRKMGEQATLFFRPLFKQWHEEKEEK